MNPLRCLVALLPAVVACSGAVPLDVLGMPGGDAGTPEVAPSPAEDAGAPVDASSAPLPDAGSPPSPMTDAAPPLDAGPDAPDATPYLWMPCTPVTDGGADPCDVDAAWPPPPPMRCYSPGIGPGFACNVACVPGTGGTTCAPYDATCVQVGASSVVGDCRPNPR